MSKYNGATRFWAQVNVHTPAREDLLAYYSNDAMPTPEAALEDAMKDARSENPRGRVVVFQGLSHWFQEGAVTGSQEESARLGPSLGSPRAVAVAADWLREVLAPAPANGSAPRPPLPH